MLTEIKSPPTPSSPLSAGDRRVHPRIEYQRPCKVFSPALQRYFLGTTRDLSAGGLLVHVPHVIDVRPGDTLHIGVSTKRRDQFLTAGEMLKVVVTRCTTTVDDQTTFAVKFDHEISSVQIATLPLAA